MSFNGKGSQQRPRSVDRKKFESNWDRIFNKDTTDSAVLNKKSDQGGSNGPTSDG